ncbi:saccharopine dehydrogenase NADP-binding domain-containing protein [Pseudomonas purpurea]|uniref:saccharopine dehydrogenase NADP-binding domain-containing protein n=1 Tax=Pseudomonas purpurea TaxID=3136737 RepID=UPI0032647298
MTGACVGLVGAYGQVGRQVAMLLNQHCRLRLGGRDVQQAQRLNAERLQGRATVMALDLWDDRSLEAFCAGCSLVINCAGPSYRVLDRVARVALAAGADYLDVGGDDPLHELLQGQIPPGRRVLLSAGMLPGLSALFPQVVGAGFERIDVMRCYAAGLGELSMTAAEDFLLSLGNGYGQALVGWSEGRRVKAHHALDDAFERPWLSGPVLAYPYLSGEQQRLFADMNVGQGLGFNLFAGEHLAATLQRIQGAAPETRECPENVAALVRASRLDVAGRTPFQLMAVEVEGLRDGQVRQASGWLRAVDGSALTGTVAALCALQLPQLPAGLHYAAQVLSAQHCVEQVRQWLPEVRMQVQNGVRQDAAVEEGAL